MSLKFKNNVEVDGSVSTNHLQLDTTPSPIPTTKGALYFDQDDEALAAVLNGYIIKIGEDQFYPVKNQTGSLIPKGTAVRFAGTLGMSGRLLIEPFIANGTVPSTFFMGVTVEDIADGENGKVLWFGRIRGINTNAFNEGDILYASTTTAGGFQTTVPQAPNNIVQVAAVISKSLTVGTIFVRPTLGSNINKDEGVKITSPATGNILQLQSNGLWENKTLAQAGIQPTLTNPITGTGTTNYLSKFTGATSLGNSQIFDNGTNVGIGTTTPASKLDVNGNIISRGIEIRKTVNTNEDVAIRLTESNLLQGGFLNYDGVNNIFNIGVHDVADSLQSNDINVISIPRSNGYVGINNTSPSERLDINGAFVTRGVRVNNLGSGGFIDYNNGEFRFVSQGPNATTAGTYSFTVRESDLGGSVNAMVIGNTGNVGIGTTSPSQLLHVNGRALTNQLQYTRAIDISSTDLNNLTDAGFYNGITLTNAPTAGWFYITVERYVSDALWVKQTATSLGSGNTGNITYTRTRQNGTWGSWVQLATTTGNVATATTLETTRTIWGQNFNGSANVTGNLTSVGNITGTAGVILTATNASLGLTATGNNSIAFTTNGSERWRINGIGELQASTSGTIRNTSGDLTITSPSGNIFITPTSTRRALVSRALVAMQGEGFGDMGMVGVLYDRNELTNAAYRGNVTITITGGGTYTDSLDVRNSIVNASGDFINISGLTTSSVVEIVVDTGANVSNYGSAGWQPFLQTRLNRSLTSTNPNSILVEVSIDGTNWHTAASNGWAISDFLTNTDTVLGGLWMGLNANPSVPTSIITWRYARFTLSNFTIGTSNNNLWISEIGVRHQSAPVARQYLNQVGGNSIWGTQIINNGNVGIGATNPAARLEVNTTTDGLISIFRRVGATKNNSLEIRGTEATGEVQLRATGTSGDQFFTFYTIGNERMRITNGGNVGIGTTSPSVKLQVETSVNGSDGLWVRNTNTGTSAFGSISCVSGVGAITLRAHSAAHSAWANTSMINSASAFTGGMVLFQDGANPISLWTNSSERMRVTAAGNVGIGTTSPASKLTVNANANSNDNAILIYNNNTVADSYVSIGSYYASGNTNVNAQVRFGNENTNGGSSYLAFSTGTGSSSSERVRINSVGNVGIGTTSINSRLDITPTANQTALGITGYSLTGTNAQSALDISGTWNTTGTPTLIKANVTNTASNANSLLMDLQVGGTSQFRVRRDSTVFSLSGYTVGAMNSFGGMFPTATGNEIIIRSNTIPSVTSVEDILLTNAQGDIAVTSGIRSLVAIPRGFNPTSGNGVYNTFRMYPTINQTGGANGITRGLYVNPTLTSAASWRSIEWSNNTGFGLYGAGTANNYLNGNLGIGTTSPSQLLHVFGSINGVNPTIRVTHDLGLANQSIDISAEASSGGSSITVGNGSNTIFRRGSNESMRIDGSGNVGIGTSSPTSKLHVNGTSLFQNGGFVVDVNNNEIVVDGNVGLQITPENWVHIATDPITGKRLRIDALQDKNNPSSYTPGSTNMVQEVIGNIPSDNVLGEPDYWMEILLNASNNIVLIPCYSPAP